jgi:predicted transposase/invertase (TIGR01784 family)
MQLSKEVPSGIDYSNIQPAITIFLVDFTLYKDDPSYHHVFRPEQIIKHFPLMDKMEIHIFELPKTPEIDDARTDKERDAIYWLRMIRSINEEEVKMLSQYSEEMKKVEKRMRELGDDPKAREILEGKMDALMQIQGVYYGGKLEMAKDMLLDGVDINVVSKYSRIPIAELEEHLRGLKG